MSYPRYLRPLILLLAVALAWGGASPVCGSPIQLDANPRYLNYNGQTLVLVGQSGEYLPHIARPTRDIKYCTLGTYNNCFKNAQRTGLVDHQLDKIRIWISLNSSIGFDKDCHGGPWPSEQPFIWTGSVWKPRTYDDLGFFTNLKNVITQAQNLGIIVEVTLFDPWSAFGNNPHSPWNMAMNIRHRQFTQPQYMVSYDSTTFDNDPTNQDMRGTQDMLVQHVVAQLNSFDNIYYEIANEPDLAPAGVTIDPVALMNWQEHVAQIIVAAEAGLKQHLIGVNLATQQALNILQNDQNLPPQQQVYGNIKLVNGHYVSFQDTSRSGALQLNQNFTLGSSHVIGFNETQSTCSPSFAGARAEAAEFLFGGGGVYDNYNLGFFDAASDTVRNYLQYGKVLASKMPLRWINFVQTGPVPGWVSGVGTYGQPDGYGLGGNTYWSTMLQARNQFGLYIHHSTIPASPSAHLYSPVCNPSGYQEMNLAAKLGTAAGEFSVEWYVYDENNPGLSTTPVCSTNVSWPGGSGTVPITGPRYPWDVALIVTRCPTGSGCPPEKSCAQVPIKACPPAHACSFTPLTCP